MQYSIIDAKDAPAAPGKVSGAAAEAASIVSQLKKGNVAKITLDEHQTVRGMRVNLSKAASKAGVKLTTWEADGYLFVKLA